MGSVPPRLNITFKYFVCLKKKSFNGNVVYFNLKLFWTKIISILYPLLTKVYPAIRRKNRGIEGDSNCM